MSGLEANTDALINVEIELNYNEIIAGARSTQLGQPRRWFLSPRMHI
jgi:hypothetical protein